VRRVNLDIQSALMTVTGALEHLQSLRDEILATLADFDMAALDKLETYARALLQADVNCNLADNTRDRAFTLFVQAYGQARRAVQYLRWQYNDAEKYAPSLYRRRRARKAKTKDARVAKGPGAAQLTETVPHQPQELSAEAAEILRLLQLPPDFCSAEFDRRPSHGHRSLRPSAALGKPTLRLVSSRGVQVPNSSDPATPKRTKTSRSGPQRQRAAGQPNAESPDVKRQPLR
jgi:hypothetical protein